MSDPKFPRWPNIEIALMHWAVATYPTELPGGYMGGHVGRDYPDPLAGYFFRPRRWSTGGRTKTNDYPVVDIEVLHGTYEGAEALIESIDSDLLGYPLRIATPTSVTPSGVVVIDHVEQTRAPIEIEYFGDSSVWRFGATYQFSLRR